MSSSFELAVRQLDYWATVYRRTWKGTVVSSFVNPLLYVLAMGVLLGGYIAGDPAKLEGAPTYLAFIAPGLLAAQSMQTAVGETTYPVMSMVKWQKVYFGMQATPLRPVDLVNAHLGFIVFRLAMTSAVFAAVLAPFEVYHSLLGAVGAWLVAVLVGLAIGLPVYAFAAGAPDESVVRAGVPARRDPAVPVLRRVLPDQQPDAGAGGDRPADAAVPGRRPDPDAHARHAGRRARPGAPGLPAGDGGASATCSPYGA